MSEPRRGVLFLPDRNRTGNDYRGAFRVEADRLAERYELPIPPVEVDISKDPAWQRVFIAQKIEAAKEGAGAELAWIAFLCHGTRRWLQLGAQGLEQLKDLAQVIAAHAVPQVIVTLYACSTGSSAPVPSGDGPGGEGALADSLRDALCVAGAIHNRVDAHTTEAHCTSNPHVRRFEGQGSAQPLSGGEMLVSSEDPEWPIWVRLMGDRHHSDLRFRFPFLERAALLEFLRQAGGG